MAEEYEAYPKVCECCPTEFAGDDNAAKKAGWRLGWDGWLCGKCNAPEQPECSVRGIISHGVACGFVISGDHSKCGYKGESKCMHMVVPN